MSAILESFRTQLGTWLIALLIAILGLFSSWFTEKIKFGLNRADLRTTQYEELASEVSQHVFFADLLSEFLEKGWTTRPTMTDLLKDYNASIITLRKKEFVYYVVDPQVLGTRAGELVQHVHGSCSRVRYGTPFAQQRI